MWVRKASLALSVLSIPLLSSVVLAADVPAGSHTAKLQHVVLGNADCVVSDPASGVPTYTTGAYTVPRGKVEFADGEFDRAVTVGPNDLHLVAAFNGNRMDVGVRGARGIQEMGAIKNSTGRQSVTLQSKDGPLTIAVPHSFFGILDKQKKGEVWYRSGAVRATRIDGMDVCFYDSNFDGVYRSGDDTMRVGSTCSVPVFAPIGRYFATQKGIYEIRSLNSAGTELEYVKYSGPTGKLSISGSDGETHLVLKSDDMAIALPCNGSAWPVIPGEYRVLYGVVCTRNGHLVAAIKPDSVKPYEVTPDKPLSGRIGGVTLAFTPRIEANKLTIDPVKFKYTGAAGEEYVNVKWSELPTIEVSRGGKSRTLGKMEFG